MTSASSFGRLFTEIEMTLDRRSRDVVEVTANNRIVTQNVFRAPDITDLIARYDTIAAPLRDRVIGSATADITRDLDDSGENAAGNLIADAQLAATTAQGAVAAFMNPGGVRGNLAAGDVTYGEAFTVQPFGNSLVTLNLTGAQLLEVLKQQWCGQTAARVLLPSAGVHYTYDLSAAAALVNQPCAGAPNPVSGPDHRRRGGGPGRHLPHHGQLVPRRRRRPLLRAARRHRPGGRRRGPRRARGLPGRRTGLAAGPRPDRRGAVARTKRRSAARAAQ